MSSGCSQPLIVDIDAFSGYICPAVIGQLLGQYQTRLSCCAVVKDAFIGGKDNTQSSEANKSDIVSGSLAV